MRFMILVFALLAQPVLADERRIITSLGQELSFDRAEGQVRYIANPFWWDLQPVFGASVSDSGAAWLGAGAGLTWRPSATSFFLRVSSMAGVYRRSSGPDLGGALQFRSALDLGWRGARGLEYGIGADHRSNAGLNSRNPGLNTGYLFVSFPLRKPG